MASFDREDVSGMVGKHLVYTYDNGWNYEIYVRNENTMDYRIHDPKKTLCFQNEHIAEMEAYREAGPAYPTEVIDEFATITFIRDCGRDNDTVIRCAASELPKDFPNNLTCAQ